MIKKTMRLSGSNRSNLHVQAALTAVTDVMKESVWFTIAYCFFLVGSMKFLQLSFVIFVGEELTVFGFVREECEKNFENHWSTHYRCLGAALVTCAHNFCFVLIKIWLASGPIERGSSRVINKLFNKILQKVSAKLSIGGPRGISKKGGPEATASFASLNIHLWLHGVMGFDRFATCSWNFHQNRLSAQVRVLNFSPWTPLTYNLLW